jgi:hypothetical protein
VDPDHQRGPLDALEAARQIEKVLAPRRCRRDVDEAVQAGFAAQGEAPRGGRRSSPEEPAPERDDFLF